MPKFKRRELAAEARRRNLEQLAALGSQIRQSRTRRHWTQAKLGETVGLGRSTISAIERGFGGAHTLDTWQRVAVALERPLRIELMRDALEAPRDAGHLAIQDLLLRVARAAGFSGKFEMATRPSDPAHTADVVLRHDLQRLLILVECWNTIGDIGNAARSTNRKVAELRQLAVVIGRERAYQVGACWVVRSSRRNQELVRRYEAVFAARFPGSSRSWLRALATGATPPIDPGIVWSDVAATKLIAWRRSSPA